MIRRQHTNQELDIQLLTAEQAQPILEELIEVYLEVYADSDDPFFGEGRYRRQITSHMTAPGWSAAVGRINDENVGYAYGFPLQPSTAWWGGLEHEPEPDFTSETGQRTFAVSEIMVRRAWRRQGIARLLHDELLRDRPEQRATLLVEPDNEPARSAYVNWGWQPVSRLRPGWEGAPLYEVLIRVLPR